MQFPHFVDELQLETDLREQAEPRETDRHWSGAPGQSVGEDLSLAIHREVARAIG